MTENRHRGGDRPSGPALFLLRIAAVLRLPGAKARLAPEKCKPPHCAMDKQKGKKCTPPHCALVEDQEQ